MLTVENIKGMNHYEILGLEQEATTQEIRKAYRDQSRIYHPDKYPDGGEEIFKAIKEAYETLLKEETRKEYDSKLKGVRQQTQGRGSTRDMYSDIFGKRSKEDALKGAPNRTEVIISFEESLVGTTKKVKVPMESTCKFCHGKGQTVLGGGGTCAQCGGKGKIKVTTTNPMGRSMTTEKKCPACRTEVQNLVECEPCGGTGTHLEYVELDINIPPIISGKNVIVDGFGKEGINGGPRGDLIVKVSVTGSSVFRRVENNLEYDAQVPYSILLLGGTILVPTASNSEPNLPLKVEPRTTPGTVLRIPSYGAPDVHTRIRGALEVKLHLSMPEELTLEQEELASKIDF